MIERGSEPEWVGRTGRRCLFDICTAVRNRIRCTFDITGEVRWFDLTETATRGFCPACGCFLFWKAHDEDGMSFSLGAIDGPTGLSLQKHIFVADKGDYYDIADDVPQREH